MLMSDFLVSRRSIRSYKNKKVDKKDLKELNNIIADANTISSDFYFTIEEDAKKSIWKPWWKCWLRRSYDKGTYIFSFKS